MAVTRLRLALLEAGCPQYVVARAAQIFPTRLSEYANGKTAIPEKDAVKLAAILDCLPDELMGYADIGEPRLQL